MRRWRPLGIAVTLMLGPACASEEPEGPAIGSEEERIGDLVLSDVRACEDPAAAASWQDMAEAWGLRGPDEDVIWHGDGMGLSLEDFDEDGQLDLLYGFFGEHQRLVLALGPDSQETGPIPHALIGIITVADVDGDGHVDALLAGDRPAIAWGDGSGTLEITELGIFTGEDSTLARQMIPIDLDSDGVSEIFVAVTNPTRSDRMDQLLRPLGDRTFEADPTALDEDHANRDGFDAVPLDVDDDGDLDIYVVNDRGTTVGPNVLWRNEQEALVPATEDCGCEIAHSGMGGSAGDFNGDGIADFFLTATTHNVLLQGLGDGEFVDVTLVADADPMEKTHDMGWGSAWLDYDNDGFLDLLIAGGDLWLPEGPDGLHPDQDLPLWLLAGDGSAFTDHTSASGLLEEASWRNVIPWDLNDDGVLDIIASTIDERPRLWASESCTAEGWLAVDAPAGTRVTVEAGGRTWTGWTSIHPGFGASTPARAWFGLGAAQEVDEVRLRLPTGAEEVLEGPLPARRVITFAG